MKPIKKTQLNRKDQELLDAFESGEFRSDMTPSRRKFIELSALMTETYLQERAQRGSRELYEAALAQVPHAEPAAYDKKG